MGKQYNVRISIGGREFNLVSDERPEYLTEIAGEVNKRINEIMDKNSWISYDRAAVLAALKFCDDYKNLKEEYNRGMRNANAFRSRNLSAQDHEKDNLRSQVVEYSKELGKSADKIKQLEKEIEALKKSMRTSD